MAKKEQIIANSTKGEIESIKGSIFWSDVEREMEFWKEGFLSELGSMADKTIDENLSTAAALTHMGDLNGRIKAVDYLLSLPDIFLQILEDQKNDTKRK